jgi:hypothetical protein
MKEAQAGEDVPLATGTLHPINSMVEQMWWNQKPRTVLVQIWLLGLSQSDGIPKVCDGRKVRQIISRIWFVRGKGRWSSWANIPSRNALQTQKNI